MPRNRLTATTSPHHIAKFLYRKEEAEKQSLHYEERKKIIPSFTNTEFTKEGILDLKD